MADVKSLFYLRTIEKIKVLLMWIIHAYSASTFDKKEKLYMFSNSKVLENGFIYRILIDVGDTICHNRISSQPGIRKQWKQ